MPKGNEELKAKIAKIQQKGKSQSIPEVPEEAEVLTEEDEMPEPEQDEDMESLEAEFEAKKKALLQKKVSKPVVNPEENLEQAMAEYSDDKKFRVEIVFQLVQLNKNLKDIVKFLGGNTDD